MLKKNVLGTSRAIQLWANDSRLIVLVVLQDGKCKLIDFFCCGAFASVICVVIVPFTFHISGP